MKHVFPEYEISLLEASDILMSGEVKVEHSPDGTSADLIISAGDLFGQYFN